MTTKPSVWAGRMSEEPSGRVQVDRRFQERYGQSAARLPEHVLRLAQMEYERQYGSGQDYERMQERGGLSVCEVIGLLADYVERLGGNPTVPRGDR